MGERLRDKARPECYDLCGCGLAKKKGARTCRDCLSAERAANRRAETLCACGVSKQPRSESCIPCCARRRARIRWDRRAA